MQDSNMQLMYDVIFSLGTYDSLPIYAISNKENSFINGRPSQQPSFLKHIGPSQIEIGYVSMVFRGLRESFP